MVHSISFMNRIPQDGFLNCADNWNLCSSFLLPTEEMAIISQSVTG